MKNILHYYGFRVQCWSSCTNCHQSCLNLKEVQLRMELIEGVGGQEIGRGSIQESSNLRGWAWWEFLGVLRLQKHPDTHQEKISVLKWCLHGFKLIACVHDRRAAKPGSHPVCTRRRWRVRHLKPKTHTLEQCKSFLHCKMSLSHRPNHIMAESSHQWAPWHIIPQLRHTLEPQSTAEQTGIFTSLTKSLCVSVLTELALLGLGHGRPVPGPLDTNESIKNVVRKCTKGLQISRLI